jgi:hypothetical protein
MDITARAAWVDWCAVPIHVKNPEPFGDIEALFPGCSIRFLTCLEDADA